MLHVLRAAEIAVGEVARVANEEGPLNHVGPTQVVSGECPRELPDKCRTKQADKDHQHGERGDNAFGCSRATRHASSANEASI